MTDPSWHYVIDGKRAGPVSAAELSLLIAEGTLTSDSLIWQPGMEGWEPAGDRFPHASPPPVPGVSDLPRAGQRRAPQPQPEETTGIDGLYVHSPARSFTEAIWVCLSNYITFSGRASRSEYWYFFLFSFLAGLLATVFDGIFFGFSGDDAAGPLNSIVNLALLLPMVAVGFRRLHDINRTGWWIGGFWLALIGGGFLIGVLSVNGGATFGAGVMLLGIAALVYFAVMLVFLCTRGALLHKWVEGFPV